MTRALLRAIAIAIAVAGAVDPAITMSGAARPRLSIVTARSGQPSSPSADRVRDRLVHDLAGSFEVVPYISSDAASAVVIGDRYPLEDIDPVPDGLLVATVTVEAQGGPNVRLVRVNAPREVPAATAIHVDADVEAAGMAGRTTDVSVRIAGLEVGRASHRWTSDRERWRAAIDAVPVGEPPFALRVEAAPFAGEAATQDNAADTSVDVRRRPFRVQVYEPRPSWATTFVRRALEADARFEVASLGFTSRAVSATSGDEARVTDPGLDTFDAVIVGGVDRLSAQDVRSLDRFMRERGGAVVLVPDLRIGRWPVRDLLPIEMAERLLDRPAALAAPPPLAAIEASELLVMSNLAPGAQVVATAGSDAAAIVVSMPHGDGRLLVSGAMDAWRFRAADGAAFDRFWQATIAGLALAAPPPLAVSVEPPLLRPGERGEVIVRVRSTGGEPVRASIDGQPIRLLPQPEAGVFRGSFTARAVPGRSTIDVHTAGARARSSSRTLLVQPDVRRARPDAAPSLSMLASSHGGINVSPDRIAEVERFVRNAAASAQTTGVRHPMRSLWWVVPFAACLSGEWWLRRRRGFR